MKRRALIRSAVVLAAFPTVLAACQGQPQLNGEVYIYVAGPLSGDQADGGQSVVGGAALRADEANSKGGVLGSKRVVVRGMDDEADEDVAAGVAAKIGDAMKSGEEVLGVIGHYNSGPTGRGLAVYRQLGLVVITPSSSNPDLTRQGYDRFFRVCATDSVQGPTDAKFMLDKGWRKIALARTDNDYAQGLGKEFAAGLAAAGGQPAVEVVMKAESPTFATEVERIRSAGVDAVFFAGDYPDGIVLGRELRQAGVSVPILASDANFVEEFIDQLGSAAQGIYVSAISPDPRAVAPKSWFDRYKALETRNPGMDSTTGYSAADVLLSAVAKANSSDGKALAAAIHSLDLTTLVGHVRYDDKGDLLEQRIYVFQVQGARFAQVYPAAAPG